MNKTAISWATNTWNFVHGCYKKSDGCSFCYAETLSLKYGFTHKKWTLQNKDENILLKPHKFGEPYTLKEPSRIFVNSMSDMGLSEIPDWFKAVGYSIMCDLPQHVFQILTKRPEDFVTWSERFAVAVQSPEFIDFTSKVKNKQVKRACERATAGEFPTPFPPNVWAGVSVEDSRQLHRIETLKKAPIQVRIISAEPLIGAWGQVDLSGIHWVIVGGESGLHLKDEKYADRWMQMSWAREIKDLCIDQQVAYFYKQDSALVTETRPYLEETDGSKWVYHQYPGDLRPPYIYGDKESPDPTTAEEWLTYAQNAERLAYGYQQKQPYWQWWSDSVAMAAAYAYQKARQLQEAKSLTNHTPLSQDDSDSAPTAPKQLSMF